MKTTMKIELDITPDKLAEVFVCWGSDEQANFLNLIGKHFKNADFHSEGQVCWIAGEINQEGKNFVLTLANFITAHGQKNHDKINVLLDKYDHESIQ